MPRTWFDAHLDLAYLAVAGRDMTKALDVASPPHPPASVTLQSLSAGGVRFALGTIFTEPVEHPSDSSDQTGGTSLSEPQMYPAGNVDRAHAAGRAQLEAYLTWRDRSLVRLGLTNELRVDPGVGEIRGGMGVAEVVTPSIQSRIDRLPAPGVLRLGILMENADPIRTPEELEWWRNRGVLAIGLAWARPSRYAGGNTTDLGLSDLGHALVREMDRLGVVHDVSHLSDRALHELLEITNKPVIASHSNCRSLLTQRVANGETPLPGAMLSAQRHLDDATIREIGRRGGVIGLNLFSKFLVPPERAGERATIANCVDHIEQICGLVGHRRSVGLGSDMDGGFGANLLPVKIDQPSHLDRLADSLSERGWSEDEIRGFVCENWLRFFLNES